MKINSTKINVLMFKPHKNFVGEACHENKFQQIILK